MQYGNVVMEHHQPAPSFLVQLLHSVPHINITLHRVNDTFNPNSTVYTEVSPMDSPVVTVSWAL
uniref:Protein tweety homolog n=1 Tax=Anopheles minimus TaxID=112268 RepID=A0A182VRQ5_9DIPT